MSVKLNQSTPPDDEIILALDHYRQKNGRFWASKLRQLWNSGQDEHVSTLRKVRNSYLPWFNSLTSAKLQALGEAVRYRREAHNQFNKEGECEIDYNAPVSISPDGDGAYVQAWVWVYRSETPGLMTAEDEGEE